MAEGILVAGSTGNVGAHLVRTLSERGQSVAAATRAPQNYKASNGGVRTVRLDYDDPITYPDAFREVAKAFLIAKPLDPFADRYLVPLIDAAAAARVEVVVLLTAFGVEHAEGTALWKTERHLKESGTPFVILRPNWFMQNFSPGFLLPGLQATGTISLPAGDARISFVDTRDVAEVAAAARTTDVHVGTEYALTGSEPLTYDEAAQRISRAAGREIRYAPISDADCLAALRSAGWSSDQADLFVSLHHVVRAGWAEATSDTVRQVLGRDPIRFDDYAREHAASWNEDSQS